MPEPSHPPYINVTQPRTLQRWLDINAQNGPLTKSRFYIVIPPYNLAYVSTTLLIANIGLINNVNPDVAHVGGIITQPLQTFWIYYYQQGLTTQLNGALGGDVQPIIGPIEASQSGIFQAAEPIDNTGVSYLGTDGLITYPLAINDGSMLGSNLFQALPDIKGQYNYTAPAPFSLSRFTVTKIAGIGTITISSLNAGRFIINDDPINPIFGSTPYYTNQQIEANFRIELWTSVFTIQNNLSTRLFTSILTNQDYRYNADNPINPTGAIQTVFPLFPIT